jgi:hypothetical protein
MVSRLDPIVTFVDGNGTRLATGLAPFIPRVGDFVTLKKRTFKVDGVTLDYEHVYEKPDYALLVRTATIKMTEQESAS